jgi:hypothetical protein
MFVLENTVYAILQILSNVIIIKTKVIHPEA